MNPQLRIRLNATDLQIIQEALQVMSVTRPLRARQALAALAVFRTASEGKYFDAGLVHVEVACEALAARHQKTAASQRAGIDETIEKLSAMLFGDSGSAWGSEKMHHFGDVLINRQAVCDRHLKVHFYEPHVHAIPATASVEPDPSYATRRGLNQIEENFDDFAGRYKVLLRLSDELIAAGDYERFDRERVVIAIQDSEGGQRLVESLSRVHSQGYRLAISDRICRLHPSLERIADIVCLDFNANAKLPLAERAERLRSLKIKLLISGVNTPADFEWWSGLKADFFVGDFLTTPDPQGKEVPLTTLPTVRLLAALQNPDVRLQELERIISQSLPLSYKLLRFLNSAYVGLPRTVLSIKHAVGLAGIRRIQQWASILLFSSIEHKPRELFTAASIRARMCEQLADSDDENRRATFFTVGLLSVLDAVLDKPMEEAVRTLPLSVEICQALIHRNGPIGSALQAVLDYERSYWESRSLSRFSAVVLRHSYLQSLHRAVSEASAISE